MATKTVEMLVAEDDLAGIEQLANELEELKARGVLYLVNLGGNVESWAMDAKHIDRFKIDHCAPNAVPYKEIPDSTLREFLPEPYVPNNCCYIYFLIENNEVVYIGQTEKLFSRIDRHRHDKKFGYYSWALVKKGHVDYFEAYLLRRYFPKYNQMFPIPDKLVGYGEGDQVLIGWRWKI